MLENLQAPLFFGLTAAFVTTIGLLAVSLRSDWSQRNANLFGLAAAGMLVTMAFLHILPKAFSLSPQASLWLTAGFFGGLVLSYVVQTLFPDHPNSTLPSEAVTPIIAIGIHSFIDGVVYAVTFAVSFESGVYAALGLILHEFPEGVIAFAILRRHGVTNRNAFIWAFLAAAATTPLGIIVSGPFMYGLGEAALGSLFGLSVGLILYVATGPLMAPLKEMPTGRGLLAIGTGMIVAMLLTNLPLPGIEHDHGPFEQPHFVTDQE